MMPAWHLGFQRTRLYAPSGIGWGDGKGTPLAGG